MEYKTLDDILSELETIKHNLQAHFIETNGQMETKNSIIDQMTYREEKFGMWAQCDENGVFIDPTNEIPDGKIHTNPLKEMLPARVI